MTPSHAYVPGQTPRHPEGAFDEIRATGAKAVTAEKAATSEAWTKGLAYYKDGYYWEAHEVLEPLWLAAPPNAPHRRAVQAMIQLANAALKIRMRRANAARRLCEIAATHMAEAGERGLESLGLEEAWFRAELSSIRRLARDMQ